jgi:hypothetical protein
MMIRDFSTNFLYKTGCLVFLHLFTFAAYSQAHQPFPSKLIGAELYSKTLADGKLRICLKTFYETDAKIPIVENVSVFETELSKLVRTLELKKDTSFSTGTKVPVSCAPTKSNSLTTVEYSGEIDFKQALGNFDFTWGYCCFEQDISNVDIRIRTASSLTIHYEYKGTLIVNNMPSWQKIESHFACAGVSSGIDLSAKDSDSDEVNYTLVAPFTYKSMAEAEYPYPESNIPNAKIVVKDPGYSGSFLTGHPPFIPYQFKNGFSADKPVKATKFNLDPKSGALSFEKIERGKYLITISISEQRNKKKLSEHQAFFMLEII